MMGEISVGSANMSITQRAGIRRSRPPMAIIFLWSLVLAASRNACADAQNDAIAEVVARVSPAVVRIVTVRPRKPEADGSGDKSRVSAAIDRTSTATGSGFIIDQVGHIATNKHVVDGAISVFVHTADGVRYPATIVGISGESDMALLRISAGSALPFVRFGDSDTVRPGDKVVAVGSPFGFDNSVITAIISSINRDIMESPFDDHVRTDAAINHGYSGSRCSTCLARSPA
jgi:serine protease Do